MGAGVMADAWGGLFGTAWGFSFGAQSEPAPPVIVTATPIAYWDVSAVQSKKTQRKHDLGAMLLLLG